MNYATFLSRKAITAAPSGISDPPELSAHLFEFQKALVRWALIRGRAALFAECGLGKGPMALEWASRVADHTGGDVLILAPLAVAQQFVREGEKFGVPVAYARSGDERRSGITVTNYERLHRFETEDLAGVVLDESSVLKAFTGRTRTELIERFSSTPFRLACTATPAPNDHEELGNHSEFLGVLSRTEMLSSWFVHDGKTTQEWRLKGHARRDFWRWVSSWAMCLGSPADIGYPHCGYDLPSLHLHEHVVDVDQAAAREAGLLFGYVAATLGEQRKARKQSLVDRIALTAEIVSREPGEQWLVWCDLNDESKALAKAIPGAVEVTGSDSEDHKERAILDFVSGRVKVLVTKPSISGFGVNLQNCARAVFCGVSHSFEAYYQATRRIWRFGQAREVHTHIVTSSAEGRVRDNLLRKQGAFLDMRAAMVEHMRDSMISALTATQRQVADYCPQVDMTVPVWLAQGEQQ